MLKWNKIDRDLLLSTGRPASDREMHRAFLEANGLTEWAFYSHGGDDLAYILRHGRFPTGRRRRPADGYPFPPCVDHARIYRGGPAMLVYHPYMRPEDIRDEVEAWAGEQGLEGRVYESAKSWYYPGRSCLVVITAGGVEVKG